MGFDHTDIAIIIAAAVAAIPAVLGAIASKRTHKEVKTNHGLRAGARVEQLGEDMAFLKSVVVTRDDLRVHAEHDALVAAELALSVERTKHELLMAIGRTNA